MPVEYLNTYGHCEDCVRFFNEADPHDDSAPATSPDHEGAYTADCLICGEPSKFEDDDPVMACDSCMSHLWPTGLVIWTCTCPDPTTSRQVYWGTVADQDTHCVFACDACQETVVLIAEPDSALEELAAASTTIIPPDWLSTHAYGLQTSSR